MSESQQQQTDPVADDVDAHARAILPGEPIRLGAHTFTVRPMKTRQVFPFLACARPLFAALVARPASPPAGLPPSGVPDADQGGNATPQSLDAAIQDAGWVLGVLEAHGPAVVRALAIGVEPDPKEWDATEDRIGDLDLADTFTLLKGFVVVNAGFFASKGLKLPTGPLPLAPLAQVVAGASPAPQ